MKKVNIITKIALCILTIMQAAQAKAQTYQWDNVAIGGGGFVSGIITCKTEQNLMYARTDVGGAYKWDNGTATWKPLLDWCSTNETGYMGVSSIAVDQLAPYRMYMLVGTSYFNSGKTAILRSADYGQTFTVTDVTAMFKTNGNRMGRQNGEKLQVDPNNSNVLYCGTESNGLWKSYDKGATWQNIATGTLNITTADGNGISFVLIDPASKGTFTTSQKLYVGISRSGSTNLYVSTNAGSSFSAVSGAPTTYMPQRAVLGSDGRLFVTYGNGAGPNGSTAPAEPMDQGAVWRYTPGTNTWANITPSGISRAFSGISVDPNNANKLVLSTINTYWSQYVDNNGTTNYGDRILYSTNGGNGWTDVIGTGGMVLNANGVTWVNGTSMHWIGCVEFDPFNTSKVWITSGQGIFSCDNIAAATTTWKFNVNGLEETVPQDIVSIPGGPLFSVISDYGGFKHTDVTQYAPRLLPSAGSTTGITFSGTELQTLIRTGNDQYYTTNQGASWTICGTSKGDGGKVAVSANGFAILHCPAGSTTTWRTIDKGTNWAAVTSFSTQNAVPVADQTDPQKFYSYDNATGIFWRSTDRGNTFTNMGNIGTGGSKIIRAVPGYDGDVWVAMNNNGLKYTTDAGATFNPVTTITNCAAVGFGKSATTNGYPAVYIWGTYQGVTGVFRSDNLGGTWTRVNDDAHEFGGIGNGQFVTGSMNAYGRVFMSTVGRGIAYGEPGGTPGGTAIMLPSLSAKEVSNNTFSLNIVPNPIVNDVFDVHIVSNKMQNVLLKITDLNGKIIGTKEVVLQAGANKIISDGLSQKSSGMYLLSAFTADGKVIASVKMVKK